MAHVNEVTQADDTRNIHEQKSNPMPIKQREQYRMRKVSSSAPPELANTSTPGSRSPSVPAEAFEYPASETSDTGAVHYSDRYFWDGSEENVVDTQRTNVDDDKHNDFLKDQSSTHGDNDQKRETSAEHSDIDPRGNPAACIFVASLTKEKNDEELNVSVSNHFMRWGTLLNVKVLKDWMNRPYAFVQYERLQDAKRALEEAPGTILDNRSIRCEPARVNRTLCISSYDRALNKETIRAELSTFGDIEDITILQGYPTPRGRIECAFVKYRYRDDAIKAFLTLRSPQSVHQWWVEWASNLDELGCLPVINGDINLVRTDYTSVFVGNLPEQVTENSLEERFAAYGVIKHLRIIRKSAVSNGSKRIFAFIKYSEESGAGKAIEAENGAIWLDHALRVAYREHKEPLSPAYYNRNPRRLFDRPHPPGMGFPASVFPYVFGGPPGPMLSGLQPHLPAVPPQPSSQVTVDCSGGKENQDTDRNAEAKDSTGDTDGQRHPTGHRYSKFRSTRPGNQQSQGKHSQGGHRQQDMPQEPPSVSNSAASGVHSKSYGGAATSLPLDYNQYMAPSFYDPSTATCMPLSPEAEDDTSSEAMSPVKDAPFGGVSNEMYMPGYYDYAPPYYPTIGYFATSRSSPNAPSDSSTSYQENCAKPARPPHKAYSFPTTGYYETTAYYNPYYGLPVPPPQPATLASATGVSGPRYIYPNSSHPRGRQYHQVQPHAPMPVINQALNYRLSPDTPSPSGSSYPSADDEDDKAGTQFQSGKKNKYRKGAKKAARG